MSKEKVLLKALRMACKAMRENPFATLDWYLEEDPEERIIAMRAGKADPTGEQYVRYFIQKALEEYEVCGE